MNDANNHPIALAPPKCHRVPSAGPGSNDLDRASSADSQCYSIPFMTASMTALVLSSIICFRARLLAKYSSAIAKLPLRVRPTNTSSL